MCARVFVFVYVRVCEGECVYVCVLLQGSMAPHWRTLCALSDRPTLSKVADPTSAATRSSLALGDGVAVIVGDAPNDVDAPAGPPDRATRRPPDGCIPVPAPAAPSPLHTTTSKGTPPGDGDTTEKAMERPSERQPLPVPFISAASRWMRDTRALSGAAALAGDWNIDSESSVREPVMPRTSVATLPIVVLDSDDACREVVWSPPREAPRDTSADVWGAHAAPAPAPVREEAPVAWSPAAVAAPLCPRT